MFERLNLRLSEWGRVLAGCHDRTIFQTPEWLSFIAETQHAEPVLAAIRMGTHVVGYFSGLIVSHCGIKILGSPLPGWTTSYMGMNLLPGMSRPPLIEELIRCAFDQWDCAHVELMDRHVSVDDAISLGYEYRRFSGFEIDLTLAQDRLLAHMTSACRRCIRKAAKTGVIIEEAYDLRFAEEYYAQLQQVLAKQSLVPTYGIDRVHALIAHLSDTGRLLLLRARDPDGVCIATGIFPAMNGTMYFWGGASRREALSYRPNEALQWYAMSYWKARGMQRYDMGGGGEYKRKFGGAEIVVPWIRKSKYHGLPALRAVARHLIGWRQRVLGHARIFHRV